MSRTFESLQDTRPSAIGSGLCLLTIPDVETSMLTERDRAPTHELGIRIERLAFLADFTARIRQLESTSVSPL